MSYRTVYDQPTGPVQMGQAGQMQMMSQAGPSYVTQTQMPPRDPQMVRNGSPLALTCDKNVPHASVQAKQVPLGLESAVLRPVFVGDGRQKETPQFGGNWSRTKYDQGSLDIDTRQATSALEYVLDPNYAERCGQCRANGPGWLGKQGVSYNSQIPIVDTESELFNLNRLLTRDPSFKYIPNCPKCGNCPQGYPCGDGSTVVTYGGGGKGGLNGVSIDGDSQPKCDQCQPNLYHFPACDVKYEYTLTSNPKSTFREVGINRFQPICLNPQDRSRWEHPGETGINYRMVVKDNHVPSLPRMLDGSSALPQSAGGIPCNPVQPACSAYTAPMHAYRLASEGPLFTTQTI